MLNLLNHKNRIQHVLPDDFPAKTFPLPWFSHIFCISLLLKSNSIILTISVLLEFFNFTKNCALPIFVSNL